MFSAADKKVLKLSLEKAKEAWETAKAARDAELEYARANKSPLADHYWQDEHRARLKYETCKALVEGALA